jgi:PAS domain S-box-containing protein
VTPPSGQALRTWSRGVGAFLVWLSLLVAVPLIAAVGWRLRVRADAATRRAERDTRHLAGMVADRIDDQIANTDALLRGLSVQLVPDPARRTANDSILRAVHSANGGRPLNLFMLDSAGTLVGTSQQVPSERNAARAFSDRGYLRLAASQHGLVVSELRRSAVHADSAWVVILARRISGPGDAFRGLVAASVVASELGGIAQDSTGEAPLVTVFDTAGVVVTRSLDGARYIGSVRPEMARSLPDTSGVTRLTGMDGVSRIVGYARTETAPWLVSVGVKPAVALADWRRDFTSDVAILLIGLTVSAGVALGFGARMTRPLAQLAEDARTFSRGLLTHRSRPAGPREVRELAAAFNQMAETVERRSAALSDSERRYRFLFESNPLPMWAWDSESLRILAVNDAAIAHYGYDRGEFLARRITDLLDPAELERFASAALPFTEARQQAGTWRHRTASGRPVEMDVVTTSSLRLGRPCWLSVGIDVTARREAERALARSEQQLRQAQKMEAIGAFAGGIAHDFNNLLTGILGYCDLALGELHAAAPGRDDVGEVRALALRGAELTRQILTVSRRQMVQPATIDPNAVIEGLDRLLRRLIGEHIALETALDPGVGMIRADAGQLEQVLLNLAANARDAMPNGGTLRITSAAMTTDDAGAAGLAPDRGWMAVTVQDTGTGMTDEVKERALEPFFTTKERGKGTGLGLALAYAAVDQAGGSVTLDSVPGHGTAVRLYFPIVRDATAAPDVEPVPEVGLGGSETILLAEDEASVRRVSVAALERAGYTVLAAADGPTAAALAESFPGAIDLLVTDVIMPGMHGRELAERVQRTRPRTRTLFASGYTDDAVLLRGIRVDEVSFLQKPYTADQLLRRVREVLGAAVRDG